MAVFGSFENSFSRTRVPDAASVPPHAVIVIEPPPPATRRPQVGSRMPSMLSVLSGRSSNPPLEPATASTAPERRLHYITQSEDRKSIWPLINLLSASVGRSFVSLGSGLLADGVRARQGPISHTDMNAAQYNVSRDSLVNCAAVLHDAVLREQGIALAAANLTSTVACSTFIDTALNTTMQPKIFDPKGAVLHQFVPGGVLAGCGIVLFCFGAGRFARDTARISPRRAMLMASVSFSGFALVVSSNGIAQYAIDSNNTLLNEAMLLPRLLGTYLIFLSIPKSFSTCEIVRGDARLPHREFIRVQSGAWAPVLLYLWGALLASPQVTNIAHELMLGAALILFVISQALNETNVARARAAAKLEPQSVDELEAGEQVVSRLRQSIANASGAPMSMDRIRPTPV